MRLELQGKRSRGRPRRRIMDGEEEEDMREEEEEEEVRCRRAIL